jgi:hypothetical protein
VSSSFGGSAGGGSSGTIRYQIVIDDSQVNSKLSSIERSLQGLNSATQSTGTGLMNLNNSVQTLGSTTQTTATDLDAINNNWQSMNQGAQNASNSVDALGNSFKSTQGGITGADGKLKNWNSSVENSETANKSFGSTLKENALSLTLTASGIVGLVSNYTQLEKAQVMANRATVNNEKAQRTLSNAQAKVNQLIAEGKKGTPEYTKAVRDLNIAQDSAKVAADRMRLAIQTFNERTASFLPQMAQDLIFVGGGITNMVSGLKDLKGLNIKGTFQGIGAAVAGIGAPLAVAIAGVYALLFALKAASNLTDIAKEKFGKAYVEMSTGYAGLLRIKQAFHLTTKEEDAALAQLDKQMSSNAITTDDYTKAVTDAAVNPLPKSVEDLITKLVNLKPPMADATSEAGDYTTANDALTGSTEDLTVATLDQTKAESEANDERVATMKSVKGAGDLFEYYRKTGNQAAITTDNLGNVTDAFGVKLGNTYDNIKTFGLGIENDIVATMEDAGRKATQFRIDFDKAWKDFGKQSFDAISKAFGDESQLDKMLKKFKKFTSKKIDVFVDMKVKEDDIKTLASTIISGLDDYMKTDKQADEVGKDLIKMINSKFKKGKTPQGAKDIIAYINYAISQPNTKELLDVLGQDIKNGEPIPVPVILTPGPKPLWDFLKDDTKKDKNGKVIKTSFGIGGLNPEDAFGAMCFDDAGRPMPCSSKSTNQFGSHGGSNMQGKTNFSQLLISSNNGGTSQTTQLALIAKVMQGVEIQAQKLQTGLANLANQGSNSLGILAKNSSVTMNGMSKNFSVGAVASQKLQTGLANLSNQGTNSLDLLAKSSSKDMNGMKKNLSVAEVGAQKLQTGLANLSNQGIKSMDALAKASSKDMNGLIHNVQAAQRAVISLIKSIGNLHSKTVTIKANVSGPIQRFAAGGEFTTHGPELIMVGDNPSGVEHVKVSPMSRSSSSDHGGRGNQPIIINLVSNNTIDGNDIINERALSKRIKLTVGENRDRFN